MTEIFDGLSVIADPMQEEDRVVHLLASLPESFNMLVTALEANPDVPKIEVVTKRLLHAERKMKVHRDHSQEKAMTVDRQENSENGTYEAKLSGLKNKRSQDFIAMKKKEPTKLL